MDIANEIDAFARDKDEFADMSPESKKRAVDAKEKFEKEGVGYEKMRQEYYSYIRPIQIRFIFSYTKPRTYIIMSNDRMGSSAFAVVMRQSDSQPAHFYNAYLGPEEFPEGD